MARTYVLIGDRTDQNGNVIPGDYPGTAAGIRQALNDGHRWLVIQEDLIEFAEPIELDAVITGHRSLRIDGGGMDGAATPSDGRTVFRKAAGFNDSLINCKSTQWQLYLSGITFDGNYPAGGDWPLMDLNKLQRSRFADCAFISNRWDGLSLGAFDANGHVDNCLLVNCIFKDNQLNGLAVKHAIKVDLFKCQFRDNGRRQDGTEWTGLFYEGLPNTHPAYAWRGLGTVYDCFFDQGENPVSLNGWFVNVRAIDFRRNHFRLEPVRFWTDTSLCHAEDNILSDGANWDDRGSSNTIINNHTL